MAKTTREPRRAIALGQTAMGALVADDLQLVGVSGVRGFKVTVNGLVIDGQPPLAQFQKAGVALRVYEKAATFALVDFITELESRFGDDAAQVLDHSDGWSESTVNVYRWIGQRVGPAVRRMDRLGIRHHMLVAPLTPERQKHWLDLAANDAEEKPWTVKRLQDALKENEDLPPTAFWLLVQCDDMAMQATLQAEMEARGRNCKALARRGQKKVGT